MASSGCGTNTDIKGFNLTVTDHQEKMTEKVSSLQLAVAGSTVGTAPWLLILRAGL